MKSSQLLVAVLGVLILSSASMAEDRDVKVFNRSVRDLRSIWVAEYEKNDLGKATRKSGPWKIKAGDFKKFTKEPYRVGKSRHIRWLKKDDFPKEYSHSEWQDINGRKGIGLEKNHVFVSDVDEKSKFEGFYKSGWYLKFKSGKYMKLMIEKQIKEAKSRDYSDAFDLLSDWNGDSEKDLENACKEHCRDSNGGLVDDDTCKAHCGE